MYDSVYFILFLMTKRIQNMNRVLLIQTPVGSDPVWRRSASLSHCVLPLVNIWEILAAKEWDRVHRRG